MDLQKDVILRALNKLFQNKINVLPKIPIDYPIQAISSLSQTLVTDPNFQIDFPLATDLTSYYENQIFYITSTSNRGFNVVSNILIDGINFCGNAKVNATPQGIVNFYNSDYNQFTPIYDIIIEQAELYCNQSFRGQKEFVEYLDGSGNDRLLLRRKKVRTITSVTVSRLVYNNFYQPLNIQITDLDVSEYQNKGILRIVPKLIPDYYSVKYFPRLPLQVKGTFGYNEDEVPSGVKEALSLLMCSFLLTQEGLGDGGLSTFSIDAYSESYTDTEGRFAGLAKTYRSMGLSMLSAYKTGAM